MNARTSDLVTLCRLFAMFERERICADRVTLPQCVALQTLYAGDVDNSGLAQALGVTQGAATRLLDGLERKGLVSRKRDAEDRRRIAVRLTASGRREAERIADATQEVVKHLFNKVPRNKRKVVTDALAELRGAAEAAGTDLLGR